MVSYCPNCLSQPRPLVVSLFPCPFFSFYSCDVCCFQAANLRARTRRRAKTCVHCCLDHFFLAFIYFRLYSINWVSARSYCLQLLFCFHFLISFILSAFHPLTLPNSWHVSELLFGLSFNHQNLVFTKNENKTFTAHSWCFFDSRCSLTFVYSIKRTMAQSWRLVMITLRVKVCRIPASFLNSSC